MKSSLQQLRNRGKASDADMQKASRLSSGQLISMLDCADAASRTAAVEVLSQREDCSKEILMLLIARLEKERALYTKLALCETLAHGGKTAARLMIPYAGQIGKNQHKRLPAEPSKKISYPLPRDVIARTLGTMSAEIMPVLREVLLKNAGNIRELVDAFGYLVSNNPALDTTENAAVIEAVLRENQSDELIVWKCVVALSSFSQRSVVELLTEMLDSSYPEIIKAEARRSLGIISAQSK